MKPYRHRYEVRGSVEFPIDMLRYDGSAPLTEGDSHVIRACNSHNYGGIATVDLTRIADIHWTPQAERWHSFGWDVVPNTHTKEKAP